MSYKIVNTHTYLLGIDLEQPFKLGFGVLKNLPRVFYRLTATNGKSTKYGWGEASIDFPFCNYDAWDIFHALEKKSSELIGTDVRERDNLLRSQELRKTLLDFPAAFCAFNMAIDDLYGRCENRRVFDLYEKQRSSGVALKSIGYKESPQELIKSISLVVKEGFVPKPKVGVSPESDIETILLVDEWARRNNQQYILDFNAIYSKQAFINLIDAIAKITSLRKCLVIEQPTLKEEGIEVVAQVRDYANQEGLKTSFMADESFVTKQDAAVCVKNNILLNYKLQKIGGLYLAREIEEETGAGRIGGMIGGTFPTALGRTYDQQAACILKGINMPSDGLLPATDYFQGSKHLIVENFVTEQNKNNRMIFPFEAAGLGVTVNIPKLHAFLVSDPKAEYVLIRNNQSGIKIRIEMKGYETYKEKYEKTSGRKYNWNL